MSAQGEDLLAWLDAAISAREALAHAAEAQDPSPWRDITSEGSGPLDRPWGVGSGWVISANDEGLWDCEGSGTLCMTADTGRFVAANDPASVLRRCAADRQLLNLHSDRSHSCPATGANGFPDEWTEFGRADICPVVQLLAEGYGSDSETSPANQTEAQR